MSFFNSPRFTQWLLGAVLAVMAGVLLFAFLYVPDIREDTGASRRTDELASCRAVYRSQIDRANFDLLDAFGDVQVATAEATVARQDSFAQASAALKLAPLLQAQIAARTDLRDAVTAYEAANALSRENPERFLAICKENDP